MKISVSEIFESIQWEWRNTGKPSIFFRFWGCNLACTWCDSKYSWDPKVESPDIMELDDVIKIIKWFNSKHIIFTWWEPALYQKQMQEIYNILWDEYTYEIETNWSKKIEVDFLDQINISPKIENSWNDKYDILALDSKTNWWYMDLKFVVSNLIDLKQTHELIKKISQNYTVDKIYFMPLWRDTKSQVNQAVIDYCMKYGYNYCLRQHIILFWDKKWV